MDCSRRLVAIFVPGESIGRTGGQHGTVSTLLILSLALQRAVPPFATDMYTPAFPQVTADLATSACWSV